MVLPFVFPADSPPAPAAPEAATSSLFPRLNKYFPLSSARAHVSTRFRTEGRSYAGLDHRGLERSNKNSNVRKDALNFLELMEESKGPRPPDKAFCVAGTGEVPCHAHVQDEGRVGG